MNVKCSVCNNEIHEKYCPTCGQYFIKQKITFSLILIDLFNNLFSLEKSFVSNFKTGLFNSKKLITNYWNGFRGYYYSPSKFLTIAALFTLLDSIFTNDFLGVVVTSVVAPQFTILIINIFILTALSFVVYIKEKKSLYEHLILNIYNVSLWTIIFIPISIALNLIDTPSSIEQIFFIPYHLLIMIWNSKSFELNKWKRYAFVVFNFGLLYGVIFLVAFI